MTINHKIMPNPSMFCKIFTFIMSWKESALQIIFIDAKLTSSINFSIFGVIRYFEGNLNGYICFIITSLLQIVGTGLTGSIFKLLTEIETFCRVSSTKSSDSLKSSGVEIFSSELCDTLAVLLLNNCYCQ